MKQLTFLLLLTLNTMAFSNDVISLGSPPTKEQLGVEFSKKLYFIVGR